MGHVPDKHRRLVQPYTTLEYVIHAMDAGDEVDSMQHEPKALGRCVSQRAAIEILATAVDRLQSEIDKLRGDGRK